MNCSQEKGFTVLFIIHSFTKSNLTKNRLAKQDGFFTGDEGIEHFRKFLYPL